jgi:hypothetical protein
LILQLGNFRQFRFPRCRLRAQILIGQALELLVEFVDPAHDGHQPLELALILRP